MQKKPLEITCYVAGAGAFGVFFRWLQDQLAFDEAGLNEKSVFNFLVPLLVIAAALLFRRFVSDMKERRLNTPSARPFSTRGSCFPRPAGQPDL